MGPDKIEGEGILAEHLWPVKPDNHKKIINGGSESEAQQEMLATWTPAHTRGSPETKNSMQSRQDLTTTPALGLTCSLFFMSRTETWCIYDHFFHQTWLKSALDPKTEGEALCRQFFLQGSSPVPGLRPGMHMHLAGSSKSSERTFQGFFHLIV